MLLAEAQVDFDEKTGFDGALAVRANARTGDYRISVFAHDRILTPKVAFTSVPPLPREDVLSLIASGVTRSELTDGGNVAATKAALYWLKSLSNKKSKIDPDAPPSFTETIEERTDVSVGAVDAESGELGINASIRLWRESYLAFSVGKHGSQRGGIKVHLQIPLMPTKNHFRRGIPVPNLARSFRAAVVICAAIFSAVIPCNPEEEKEREENKLPESSGPALDLLLKIVDPELVPSSEQLKPGKVEIKGLSAIAENDARDMIALQLRKLEESGVTMARADDGRLFPGRWNPRSRIRQRQSRVENHTGERGHSHSRRGKVTPVWHT